MGHLRVTAPFGVKSQQGHSPSQVVTYSGKCLSPILLPLESDIGHGMATQLGLRVTPTSPIPTMTQWTRFEAGPHKVSNIPQCHSECRIIYSGILGCTFQGTCQNMCIDRPSMSLYSRTLRLSHGTLAAVVAILMTIILTRRTYTRNAACVGRTLAREWKSKL